MRNEFMKFLTAQADIDPDIYLLVGDVGFSVIEEFKARYPDRYINTGVSEQAMIGLAAGLAMMGKKVYVYSIIPFVTMRCFEQIRDDICNQNLNVKVVGVGGGFSYGPMGVTHHALEDVAILRCLPEMSVVVPGSKHEARELVSQFYNLPGPGYLRLSNNEELVKYPESIKITLGKAIEIIPNKHRIIVASGNALDLGWNVCQHLQQLGVDIGLVSMPTVKPLDVEFFVNHNLDAVFTIEEHFIACGLGESIARVLSEQCQRKIIFKAFGVGDFYLHEAGSRAYMKEKAGLSVPVITTAILEKLNHHVQHTRTGYEKRI